MTKSPVRLAKEALKPAQKALPRYSNRFWHRDFTQPQLFAILALRQLFKTDYRGIVQMLEDFSDLRKALGSALRARTDETQAHECLVRVLTHNLMIL